MSQRALQSTQNPRGDPTYAQYPCVLPGLRVQRYPQPAQEVSPGRQGGLQDQVHPIALLLVYSVALERCGGSRNQQ